MARNTISLTRRTVDALREKVLDSSLEVGAKLPAEKELVKEFGVSRTVVREAIAALRADGVLEARHGVGVFLASKPTSNPKRTSEPLFSSSVMNFLELRLAVEVSAAGLAAVRRTWAQDEKIFLSVEAYRSSIDGGETGEDYDFAFHRAVAEATSNDAFVEFIDLSKSSLLPRSALSGQRSKALISKSYLENLYQEHRAIADAISKQDKAEAEAAMRAHLGQSQARYRALSVASGPAE